MRIGSSRASAAGIGGLVAVGLCALAGLARGAEPPAEAEPRREAASARPPLPDAPAPVPVPWERHLEIGPDLVFAALPATRDATGMHTPVRFDPTVGFGLHLKIDVLRYLGVTAYFVDARHKMN